jgi:hypothetical protein
MRLFLIWYQILQDNASDECHQIFLQLVPGLGKGEQQDILYGKTANTPDSKFNLFLFTETGITNDNLNK